VLWAVVRIRYEDVRTLHKLAAGRRRDVGDLR
jgi:hypothetical protein